MSTTNIAAAELAPVVYCMASALDGARSAIRNLPRAAALLAPALTANARAYNHGLPDAEHLAPVTEADLLAACTVAYCTRTGLHRAAPMARTPLPHPASSTVAPGTTRSPRTATCPRATSP